MKRTLIIALLCLLPIAASPQGVNAFHYAHLTQATANNSLANTGVMLHTVVVNISTSGTLAIVDTAASDCSGGTAITGTGTLAAGSTLIYDVATKNGLCIKTGGTIDATVSWR